MLAGHVEYLPITGENGKISYVANYEKYPPKIPDDSVKYITEFTSRFVESEDHKLVITITKI